MIINYLIILCASYLNFWNKNSMYELSVTVVIVYLLEIVQIAKRVAQTSIMSSYVYVRTGYKFYMYPL